MSKKSQVLVIAGQTATGKTDLALALAKQFDGELISCDSRQVYTGLDIGTGKLPGKSSTVVKHSGYWIINGIKVWLYDVADPKDQYSVYEYVQQVMVVISTLWKKGKLPIIVGGSGLYLKGLLDGFTNLDQPVDQNLRVELNKQTVGELQNKLRGLSPTKFKNLNSSDQSNPRRLIRAIEILTNPYIQPERQQIQPLSADSNILKIGSTTSRTSLNSRIDLRLARRIESGLIEEGQRLVNQGLSFERMRQLGLEYRALADLLDNKINKLQFEEQLKIKIHQYAKEQLVWFKKDPKIVWFDVSADNFEVAVAGQVAKWYDKL